MAQQLRVEFEEAVYQKGSGVKSLSLNFFKEVRSNMRILQSRIKMRPRLTKVGICRAAAYLNKRFQPMPLKRRVRLLTSKKGGMYVSRYQRN